MSTPANTGPALSRFTVPNVPKLAVYVVGFIPAALLFWQVFTGRGSADPIAYLEHELGQWALRLLIATLCISPLREHLGINLLRYRRALGLLAFYYVVIHLGVWLVLDRGLDLRAVFSDILRRPYITIGMLALVLLVPLALTSNNWSIRKMGGKAWTKLHKLAYPAIALGAIHFIMVKKVWLVEPMIYAAIVAVLLAWRVWRHYSGGGRPKARKVVAA